MVFINYYTPNAKNKAVTQTDMIPPLCPNDTPKLGPQSATHHHSWDEGCD